MLTALALAVTLAAQTPPPQSHPADPEGRAPPHGSPSRGLGPRDRDRDGSISREEFVGPVEAAFTLLDKDGDGRISREEMAEGRAVAAVILGRAGGPPPHGPGGPRPEGRPGSEAPPPPPPLPQAPATE